MCVRLVVNISALFSPFQSCSSKIAKTWAKIYSSFSFNSRSCPLSCLYELVSWPWPENVVILRLTDRRKSVGLGFFVRRHPSLFKTKHLLFRVDGDGDSCRDGGSQVHFWTKRDREQDVLLMKTIRPVRFALDGIYSPSVSEDSLYPWGEVELWMCWCPAAKRYAAQWIRLCW